MALIDLRNKKMTPAQAQEVIKALREKGVKLPCPRCGNGHFTLLDGFFNQPVSTADWSPASQAMAFSSGPTVPSVVTACTRCGFVSQHALGALGLLPTLSGLGRTE
jgi:ribosomal protein S27AE